MLLASAWQGNAFATSAYAVSPESLNIWITESQDEHAAQNTHNGQNVWETLKAPRTPGNFWSNKLTFEMKIALAWFDLVGQ